MLYSNRSVSKYTKIINKLYSPAYIFVKQEKYLESCKVIVVLCAAVVLSTVNF